MFCFLRRKKLIDREIEVYKAEKMLAVNKQIEDYRIQRQTEVSELGKQCHEQIAQYEHEFHSTKEARGIELAKLQSKIDALEQVVQARNEVIQADNNLVRSKDKEIERLNTIIELFISKQPTTIIQQPIQSR